MKKLRRGSAATTLNGICDLEKVAKIYSNVGEIPENMGWSRACEIALLCRYFLLLLKYHKKREKEDGKKAFKNKRPNKKTRK